MDLHAYIFLVEQVVHITEQGWEEPGSQEKEKGDREGM